MNIKYYLDKPDKNGFYPIHLVIRHKKAQVKVSLGEKIKKKDWDGRTQAVKDSNYNHKGLNKYLFFLRTRIEEFLLNTPPAQITITRIKELIVSYTTSKKFNEEIKLVNEDEMYYSSRQKITFVDFFAGAGGFSEGFLQAEFDNRIYDFLLASDINENCELTHVARYNYQLGLSTSFLRQDITESDFFENLVKKLDGKSVDVICGGPPCQSFSLAGKRRKFDKKDNLFAHYLDVIKRLRPKYFVMENVKGILTKENGKIAQMILSEIRSIVDLEQFPKLLSFVSDVKRRQKLNEELEYLYLRLLFETTSPESISSAKEKYIQTIENKFKELTPKIFDYKTSKTDERILTVRHGLSLLKRFNELAQIRKKIIVEKANSDLDTDQFVNGFNSFLELIETETIIEKIVDAIHRFDPPTEHLQKVVEIEAALEIFDSSLDECFARIKKLLGSSAMQEEFEKLLSEIRLYNIELPFVALASNYGVPQNRERVLFIGCRKDQAVIASIPPTVNKNEKVTVFEALYDLDFVGNDDERFNYENVDLKSKYNGKTKAMVDLIKKRAVSGEVNDGSGLSYAEWSRTGRLNGRFKNAKNPFYVRNFQELENSESHLIAPLLNHKTSNQNAEVIKRLNVILKSGKYSEAKSALKEIGLHSDKRNYNILYPESQSPTIMTIPDDYIHFSNPRPLTVREMARLQSFDDSFVFQGKRSTGGNKRKVEVPQCTLVGNAVPPLMARAVAMEILKKIK